MKILITGSSGLLGTALKQALDSAGITFDVIERTAKAPKNVQRVATSSNGPDIYTVNWPAGLSELPYSCYSTIIHLALPYPDAATSLEESVVQHVSPVQKIIEGIVREGSTCSLVFMSSQSASPNATSAYGKGKLECERLLEQSPISWTVLRPGLVMSHSAKGLFGAMVRLIKHLPIVPVPAGTNIRVQPVLLTDVITACLRIISDPSRHNRRAYDLALHPMSLPAFIREVCRSLNLKRLILPIPWRLVSAALTVSECLRIRLPIARSNLEGLLASREMRSDTSAEALRMTLTRSLMPAHDEPTDTEARYLFKAMFGFEPPSVVTTRYNSAQRQDLLNGAWINIDKIIQNRLDIEAIEFAARSRRTILTQKMHIMCYVAEQSPVLLPAFVNTNTCRIRAFAELGLAGIRSTWKLVLGSYLLKRYALLSTEPHD